MEKQGWKVFDLTEYGHFHAGTLLGKLSERKYASVEEVLCALISKQIQAPSPK